MKIVEVTAGIPEYVYHATPADNLSSIRQYGLIPGGPEGKSNFPDGPAWHQDYLWFSSSPAGAKYYFDNAVVVRVPSHIFRNLHYFKTARNPVDPAHEFVTSEMVPPEYIQIVSRPAWNNEPSQPVMRKKSLWDRFAS